MSDAASSRVPTPEPTRRDFLYVATAAVGAVGAAATLVPLITQMEPDASTIAAGGPVDFDISKVTPGAQVRITWRSRPIFIVHRTPAILKELQSAKLTSRLSDPASSARQQPPYAQNRHRSIKP
jgi:ubiquinol-cytochrome c reductase iron-sulfur subunit